MSPSDPELIALARLICGTVGAASLDSWLTPRDPRGRVLRKLGYGQLGSLDPETIRLIEELLASGADVDAVVARVNASLAARSMRERVNQVFDESNDDQDEEDRSSRPRNGP